MRVSAQLYTVRHCGGLSDQLQLAAACGFADVETTGLHDLTPREMAGIVRHSGLHVRSAHFDWAEFETRFPEIIEVLGLLGCQDAVMPWLAPAERPGSATGWVAVSDQLSDWADHLAQHGIRLAYHNHDFDLAGPPGEMPLDLILAPGNIWWQPDIGWLIAAGLNPATMIAHHANRIRSVHAKDIWPQDQGDARWRDLGEGVVDWPATLRALAQTPCTDLFVEHDETSDHRRTLRTGRSFLTEQLGRLN